MWRNDGAPVERRGLVNRTADDPAVGLEGARDGQQRWASASRPAYRSASRCIAAAPASARDACAGREDGSAVDTKDGPESCQVGVSEGWGAKWCAHPAPHLLFPSRDAGSSDLSGAAVGRSSAPVHDTAVHASESSSVGGFHRAAGSAAIRPRAWRHSGDEGGREN